MFFFIVHLRSDSTELAELGVLNDKLGSKFGEKMVLKKVCLLLFDKNDDP